MQRVKLIVPIKLDNFSGITYLGNFTQFELTGEKLIKVTSLGNQYLEKITIFPSGLRTAMGIKNGTEYVLKIEGDKIELTKQLIGKGPGLCFEEKL